MDENTPNADPVGFNRRDMLRRSALVGGALIWTAPAVQTLAAPAFAAGSTVNENCPAGFALSEVTALLLCGGKYYWVKYNPQTNGGTPTDCGPNINVAQSNGTNADATCDAAEAAIRALLYNATTNPTGIVVETTGCPTATVTTNGNLCLPAGCTVLAWTVHDGSFGATHCAYKIGTGAIQYNPGGGILQICTSGGTTCFSKSTA